MRKTTTAPDSDTWFVFDSSGEARDTGLFGPDSMAWKVWSHPAAFVGAIRSFLAEMLVSPEGADATANTGLYKQDPVGRLQRTMHYFLTVVYGDTATVDKANLRLNRMHSKITGTTPLTGRPYIAVSPLMQLAVMVLTWHSVWVCYEALVGKQSQVDEDRFFAESVRASQALGLDKVSVAEYRRLAQERGNDGTDFDDWEDGKLPATRAEYVRFMRASEPSWCVTPDSRDILNTMLAPSIGSDLRAQLTNHLYPVLSNAAVATLPRRMRAMASIPTSKTWEARSITLGRAAVNVAALPQVSRAFQHEVSPRGYALMRDAFARS